MIDQGYIGPIALEAMARFAIQCRNASFVDTAPDGAPTWAIYGADDTPLLTGSLGGSNADSKTGFRTGNAAITAANGFARGGRYAVRFNYEISSTAYSVIQTFTVV